MDFNSAKTAFEHYLDGYDRGNDKVRLKIVHTYGVVSESISIAERMKLSSEDLFLAKIIALLHDIGRFEQLKQFDSFQPETMDHALYGVELLFGEKRMIRQFLAEDKWDHIIRISIEKHSDFILEGIEDEHALLHAKLIRDADKLDNCRVKLEDALETFMGACAEEIGRTKISAKVKKDMLNRKSILSSDRLTLMDYWVSYLAYFYDLNFRESLDIVEENDYVSRIIKRIPYSDPETKKTMKILEEQLSSYLHDAKR